MKEKLVIRNQQKDIAASQALKYLMILSLSRPKS